MKRVVAAVIEKDGKLLVCQRTRHQTMPLKWEFPGGKIEEGEQPRDALRRELEEELGIHAKIGDEIARLQHTYPNGRRWSCGSLSCASTMAKSRIASSAICSGQLRRICHLTIFLKRMHRW